MQPTWKYKAKFKQQYNTPSNNLHEKGQDYKYACFCYRRHRFYRLCHSSRTYECGPLGDRASPIRPSCQVACRYRCKKFRAARAYYHGVAEEGVPFREIVEVIGRSLKVPVVNIAPEEAANHFGWFAHFAALDIPASSQKTRELLGWKPNQPGLIADLDREQYFKT